MTKNEAQQLVPGNRVKFPPYAGIWEVMKIVERGVVLQLALNGSHQHVCEWNRMEDAVLAYRGIPPVFTTEEQMFLDSLQ